MKLTGNQVLRSLELVSEANNRPQEEIAQMSGPFAVQEYIQEKIRNDPSDIKGICEPPPEVDENDWQYEHIR